MGKSFKTKKNRVLDPFGMYFQNDFKIKLRYLGRSINIHLTAMKWFSM